MEGLVLAENRVFLVTDNLGDVPIGNTRGYGLYHLDTRFLSALTLEINGFRPELLTSSAEHNYLENIQLTNPSFILSDGTRVSPQTISIRRIRFINGSLEERIGLFSYNRFPVPIEIVLTFSADFRDMFEVRGYLSAPRGQVLEPTLGGQPFSPESLSDTVSLNYVGLDGLRRRTDVILEQQPTERAMLPGGELRVATAGLQIPEMKPVEAELAPMPPAVRVRYRLVLEPQRPYALTYSVLPVVDDQSPERPRARFDIAAAEIRRSYEQDWLRECASVETSNAVFDQMLYRSEIDLRALLARYPSGPYPLGGVPWHSAPLGRDALITASQTLLLNPELAIGTLRFLAAHQGKEVNHWRDEEPGKIPHEVRYGELTNRGEVPYSPYYGSVDATPLFLILFGKLMDWLDDESLYEEFLPAVDRALDWIDLYGDLDGDGLVEYATHSPRGLRNQAWRDSEDSYRFPDGSLAEAPIASVEVQGYVYDAKVRLAGLFRRKGRVDQADRLEREARELRRAVDERFWMPDEDYYALALDHRKVQVPAVTSNPGHLLWSNAVEPERAEYLIRRLLADDLFGGWGIRTLSALSPNFNPMGYHEGTVWPHDNAIIASGLRRYNHPDQANRVVEAVFHAGLHFRYFRLPELYCGFTRDVRYRVSPSEYPVASSPQSWAAGSTLQFLKTMLGLRAEAWAKRVIVRPHLPEWLSEVTVRRLRVGKAQVDFIASKDGVRVLTTRGEVDVVVG